MRLALACEYSRTPIRRAEITAMVLGLHSRSFRSVFADAQEKLQEVFGMEMVELPAKGKVTIQQRRSAAQTKNEKGAGAEKGTGMWVLVSRLPEKYRSPAIVAPPNVPTSTTEAQYVGLYSFVVSVIALSNSALQEGKLERYLTRVNANESTPIDRTDKLLARMAREGYIQKMVEGNGEEQTVEYVVGPRGKVEIGVEGVAGLARIVYRDEDGELERKLERSLGGLGEASIGLGVGAAGGDETGAKVDGEYTQKRRRARPKKGREREAEEESSGEQD